MARFIRTACDSFGPQGDEKNGCRKEWEVFCGEKLGVESKVTSFRMNRFNNFFQGAATLFHHQHHIVNYLSNYRNNPNLKLESVLHDAQSTEVQCLVRAVGMLYYKVTGPFWMLLESNVQYVDLYIYVQQMLACFEAWSSDASPLLSDGPGIFESFQVPKDQVYQTLCVGNGESGELAKKALEVILPEFIKCTKRQLDDFLPGGKYGSEPPEELRGQMRHCRLTNLVSENEFGDLDFSQYRRRHASLHFHSGIQMAKRNKTISKWLSSKPEEAQSRFLKFARSKSHEMRQKHMLAEKAIVKQTKERLDEVNRGKQEKEAKAIANKQECVTNVQSHGGPCKCEADVRKLLASDRSNVQKKNCLKDEIRYLKIVLGVKDKNLIFGKKNVDQLASSLIVVLGGDIGSNDGQILALAEPHAPPPRPGPSEEPHEPAQQKTQEVSSNSENENEMDV